MQTIHCCYVNKCIKAMLILVSRKSLSSSIMAYQCLLLSVIFLAKLEFLVLADTAQDCITKGDVQSMAYNGTLSDHVDICAYLNTTNAIPFTLCNQQDWLGATSIFSKSFAPQSRIFIGLSAAYGTNEYPMLSDGNFVLPETIAHVSKSDGDTSERCVATKIPTKGKSAWFQTTQPHTNNTLNYYICKTSVCLKCLRIWESESLQPDKSCGCYKTSPKSYQEAVNDCLDISGKLITTLDLLNPSLQKIGDKILEESRESQVQFWVTNGTRSSYISYGQNQQLQFEKVKCQFNKNDFFLCIKPYPTAKNNTSYRGCFNLPLDSKTILTFSSPHMQIRYCMSVCRGQGKSYAGLRGQECYCLDNLLPESSEICNTKCPGHPVQACGGPNSISVYNKDFYNVAAKTCQDYYKLGFYPPAGQPIDFESSSGGKVTCSIENMFPPSPRVSDCPIGFVQYFNSCFYIEVGFKAQVNDAQKFCQTIQSDLATIESNEELLFIRDTVQRPYSFSKFDNYYVGGYFSQKTQNWTWINGKPFQPFPIKTFKLTSNYNTDKCLTYNLRKNNKMVENFSIENCNNTIDSGIICKYNQQFLGFLPMLQSVSNISHVSEWMSVTSCKQLCLNASNTQLIQVLNDTCNCYLMDDKSFDIIKAQKTFNCTLPIICPGNAAQICGCDRYNAAVYSVDINTTYQFQSCQDLNNNGIRINGLYTLASAKPPLRPTLCDFTNTWTKCSDIAPGTYIYYRNNCYRIETKYQETSRNAELLCQNEQSLLAKPTDSDYLTFFNTLIAKYSDNKTGGCWIGKAAMYETEENKCATLSAGVVQYVSECDTIKSCYICQYGVVA